MAKTRNGLVQIGTVGIDAGMLYLGDPCYFIERPLGAMPWGTFLETMYEATGEKENAAYWPVRMKYAETDPRAFQAGMVVTTGDGDGEYPVYAVIKDGRVRRVVIDFGPGE